MTDLATAPVAPALKTPQATAGPRLNVDALSARLGQDTLRLQAPMTLRAGKLYVVWGPSGSGKSSFARALLGLGELAKPRTEVEGQATLIDALGLDHPLWRGQSYAPAARAEIAFLPQAEKLGFIDGLSTQENLRLFFELGTARGGHAS